MQGSGENSIDRFKWGVGGGGGLNADRRVYLYSCMFVFIPVQLSFSQDEISCLHKPLL